MTAYKHLHFWVWRLHADISIAIHKKFEPTAKVGQHQITHMKERLI